MGSHRIYIFVLVQVYRRFKEVIIAVDWGQCGGFLAVAGSKGTLAIYSIDTSTGLIDVQYCEKKPFHYCSLKWSPVYPLLACGSIDG